MANLFDVTKWANHVDLKSISNSTPIGVVLTALADAQESKLYSWVPLSGENASERARMDEVDQRRCEVNRVAEKIKMSVLFLTKDLLFSSRVSGLTQASGIELSVVSQADQLVANDASKRDVQLVLLDLSTPGLDLTQLVPQLRRATRPPKAIIAFGPHVHAARLAAAREAGCDEVLTRGEFNSHMEGILAKYMGGSDQSADEAEASDTGQV